MNIEIVNKSSCGFNLMYAYKTNFIFQTFKRLTAVFFSKVNSCIY